MIDFDFKGGFMNLKGIIFDMDGVIVDTEYQDFLIQKDFIKHLNQNLVTKILSYWY